MALKNFHKILANTPQEVEDQVEQWMNRADTIHSFLQLLGSSQAEGSLYNTFKNNLASCIVDICQDYLRQTRRKSIPKDAIPDIANTAANEWLSTLINAGKDSEGLDKNALQG